MTMPTMVTTSAVTSAGTPHLVWMTPRTESGLPSAKLTLCPVSALAQGRNTAAIRAKPQTRTMTA
jgi:hypothetical protein